MSFLLCFTDVFTSNLSNWDVSNVINTEGMFNRAHRLKSNLDGWDTLHKCWCASTVLFVFCVAHSCFEHNSHVVFDSFSNQIFLPGTLKMFKTWGQCLIQQVLSRATHLHGMFLAALAWGVCFTILSLKVTFLCGMPGQLPQLKACSSFHVHSTATFQDGMCQAHKMQMVSSWKQNSSSRTSVFGGQGWTCLL